MAYISKIEMRGFKSFGNKKVTLPLSPGLTAIIGPNGCGKSNIIDALSFVLGQTRARTMRTERFSELIFNGGKSRRPAPYAEVSLLFDNTSGALPIDSTSIKISRRVERNGSCTYRINNKRVTREKIVDILSEAVSNPDGHNFVMQGDVSKFIDISGKERRQIIDGLAGVAEFDEKKNRALGHLDIVQGNINTMRSRLEVMEKNVKELYLQKEAALKSKELEKEIKETHAALVFLRKEAHESKVARLKASQEKNSKKILSMEKKLNSEIEKKDKLAKQEEALSADLEDAGRSTANTQLAEQKVRLETLSESLRKTRNKSKDLKKRAEELKEQMEQLAKEFQESGEAGKISKLSSEFSELREEFNKITEGMRGEWQSVFNIQQFMPRLREILDRMYELITELDNYIGENLQSQEQLTKLATSTGKRQSTIEKLREIRAARREIKKQRKENKSELEELKSDIEKARALFEEAKAESDRIEKSTKASREKREDIRKQVREINRNIGKLRDEIGTLKERNAELSKDRAVEEAELNHVLEEWEKLSEKITEKPKATISQLERKLSRAKTERDKLGELNLQAPRQYREKKAEYDSDKKRFDVLVSEKQTLLDSITDIDRRKTEVFMKIYDEVSKNFTEIYENLSPGGSGNLVLRNPELSLEERELDIEASPAGKKPLHAKLLSGGERGVVAVAFIFALQRIRPTTLYVMDEIDAPFDPQNRKRVAKMLKESAKGSQVIVATLHDTMMSVADRIFSVTVDKAGESHLYVSDMKGLA